MEKENITKNQYEEDYILLIETLELKLNEKYKNQIKIKGKLLYETENISILFHIFIYKSTEINPFEADIEMTIDFIENEPPYVQIMTNFLEPTLYDIKNYFLCLTKKKDYIFSYKYFGKFQIIFIDILSHIQIFLHHLYDAEVFKTFIYFGEYSLNHIYHINNFLKNNEILDFFRVNRVRNEDFYEKIFYIILTEIYLIVFEPDDNNKSLGKILFYKKLSEISVSYEEVYMHFGEDKVKKKLKVTIKDLQNKILFKEKNNGGVINHKIKISYLNYNSNTSNTNSSQINDIEEKNDLCNKLYFLFINKEEDDDKNIDYLKKEYDYFKQFIIKKKVIIEKEYQNIIFPYWLIFNNLNNLNKTKYSLEKNKDEVNKLIEYNEKLFKKYTKRKEKLDKIILNNAISNIIFLCSEMTSCLINDEQNIINFYVEKIQKYSNYLIE